VRREHNLQVLAEYRVMPHHAMAALVNQDARASAPVAVSLIPEPGRFRHNTSQSHIPKGFLLVKPETASSPQWARRGLRPQRTIAA
jgi:hypothetical protein